MTANHLGLVRVQAEALADHPLAAGDEAAGGAVLGLVRGLGRAQHHLTSTSVSVELQRSIGCHNHGEGL